MFRQISVAHLWYLAQLSKGLSVSTRKVERERGEGSREGLVADWRVEGGEQP